MKAVPLCIVVAALFCTQPANAKDRMLSHDVYFALNDNSTKAKKELIAGCKKYLSKHPGTVWFAAGMLVEEHQRDVNDRDFDVALHIIFKDKASHDKYQKAADHHKFIEEFKDNWKSVRVFDSWLDAWNHPGEAKMPSVTMLYVQEATGSIDDVTKRLKTATAAEKFGILGIHDLKQKLNAKGVDFAPECRIFEICNPKKAKTVLEKDISISNALPCRISVYEEGGKIRVSTLKPTALLGLFGRPELEPVAKEVEAKMIRIIDAACGKDK